MKNRTRCHLLLMILLTVVGGLVWRVISLNVFEQGFLRHQGEARTIRVVSTAAYRGMITDRNGEPLAISTPVDSVWLNPKEFDPEHPQVLALASSLDLSLEQLLKKHTSNIHREFVYLQRHVTPKLAEQIKSLAVAGIHLKPEYKRFYPTGEVSAHVLGFTNIDGGGQEGMELAFDQWLAGSSGSKRIVQDRRGREVQTIQGIKEMNPGQDLALSLDQRLQYLAYRELKSAVSARQATAGSVVILDVKTGEVLAMVNQPSFNPNMRIKLKDGRLRNRAVTDVFEPGSVMKTFSVASALENGHFTPTTLVDTSPGFLSIGGHPVREVKNKNYGRIDVRTILQKSSNVGITKLTLSFPPETLWNTYSKIGFGKVTGSGFPGESGGTLVCPPKNGSFVLATLSFGYGMSVTPLQLAQAYAVLGAGGVRRPVTFLKQHSVPLGKQVMEPAVAYQMIEMLKGVVFHGSGVKAQVLGYQTAGKTGTTRKLNPAGGYLPDNHVAIFAGVAPANDPRFSIVVMIDDPKGEEFYGSQIAAPVFSKIAAGALRILNIAPDAVDIQNLRVAQNNGPSLNE